MNISKDVQKIVNTYIKEHPEIIEIIIELITKYPELESSVLNILKVYMKLVECFKTGHKLFICGNGGSFTDSVHISSELIKSFTKKRELTISEKEQFIKLPYGAELSNALERGFPVHVLGLNNSLFSALENDVDMRFIGFAQELFVMCNKGDVFLGISTSGNAKNVIYAATTAKAKGLTTIALTGESGGELAQVVDLLITVPQKKTYQIQELHLPVYHTICRMVEAHFFTQAK